MRKVLCMCAAITAFAVAQAGQANAGFLFFGDSGASKCCQTAPAPQCCQVEDRCPLTGLPRLSLPKLSFPKLNLFGSSNNCCKPVCVPAPTCSGGAGHAVQAPAVEELSAPPSESAAKPYEEKTPGPPAEVPAAKPAKDAPPAPEAAAAATPAAAPVAAAEVK